MIEKISGIVAQNLSEVLQTPLTIKLHRKISGGSINHVSQLLTDTGTRYCCKINLVAGFENMFESEAAALSLLRKANVIRVPEVITSFVLDGYQVLVLEWVEAGHQSIRFWQRFGEQLSRLHQVKGESFGLDHPNYMGALPQSNREMSDWPMFFYEQRIQPQVELAVRKRLLTPADTSLFDRLPAVLRGLFPDAAPRLVHGDLWSGNFICDSEEQPVLIDPAAYYGHPAVDMAMTTLFGGFDKMFYESYNYHLPLSANYREQWDCCNLYPLLVHLNLFGKSYLGAILDIIKRY